MRLTPYEILFLRKQSDSGKKRNTEDDIEMLALLVAPEKCDLYQKKYSHPDFSSVTSAPNVLTCCLDSTLMLRSPLGTFFFNGDGQLTHSFGTGQRSSTYDYCDGKLARIHYPDYLDLSFEYEDGKIIGINGLPNSIHLEYDDEHHLCRIYDDQGSYLRMISIKSLMIRA